MNTVEERLARYRYELDAVPDTPAAVGEPPPRDRRADARRVLVLVCAAALLIVGLVAVAGRSPNTPATGGDGAAPFAWTTSRVAFTANTFTIDVGGRRFSPTGVHVDAHSDPGDATYATLELTWVEHDVTMNVNVYFAADAADWWVTEMRTYNGKSLADADWVTFAGDRFRSPAGGTFTGDVDLTATEGGVTSHLQIGGMTLALRPATSATGAGTLTPDGGSVPSVSAVAASPEPAPTVAP